jgi:hypothetical protein
VSFEEGQSRRRVVEGPTTFVVVIAVLVVLFVVGEEVVVPVDCEDIVVKLCGDGVVELIIGAWLFFFDEVLAPTPPPIAAATTIMTMTASTKQKVFAATPHIRRPVCEAGAWWNSFIVSISWGLNPTSSPLLSYCSPEYTESGTICLSE